MSAKNSVLVVDDQPENIHILLQALQEDYAVLAATNGERALQLARNTPPPDLILLDVMMPDMDGYEVCRRLKANEVTCDIPVIFVTSLHEAENEAKGLELGAIDYVVKPVNPDLLKARVANHIALRQAARLREDVERILRHDLRGAVSGVIGLPRLVLKEALLSPEHREMLQMVEKAGYRMLQMLNLGLDLYKMEQGVFDFEPHVVDLGQVLHDVIASQRDLSRLKDVRVQLLVEDEQADTLHVQGEALLCHCMADNLVRNALEASSAGGVVLISLGSVQDRGVLTVHNQGAVPEEIRERFFEKYATAGKPQGTGLGAYSARLMARTMGGDISWSSSQEEGTCIHVQLPLAAAPPKEQATLQAQPPQMQHPLRILVVDDDLQAGMLLKRQLQALGHEIQLAGHGREALEHFAPGRFHLVLMDKEMPVMDGHEACSHIRQLEREAGAEPTHMVALTGHDSTEVHEQLQASGFTSSLQKPLHPETLHGLLQNVGQGDKQTCDQESSAVVCEVDEDLRKLLPDVLRALQQDVSDMADLQRQGEWEAIRRQGHKRKGTCQAYGLVPLSTQFARLEAAAGVQDAEVCKNALKELTSLLERIELRYIES